MFARLDKILHILWTPFQKIQDDFHKVPPLGRVLSHSSPPVHPPVLFR